MVKFKELRLKTNNILNTNVLVIQVSEDYYMQDGIRLSLFPSYALDIADKHDCVLPSQRLVDLIWLNADIKLEPITFRNNRQDIIKHNNLINMQLQLYGNVQGCLIAGHKKDILGKKNGKVIIYGWHRTNGKPIQPLSSIHSESYKDYSHGTRLVKKKCFYNGKEYNIDDPFISNVLLNVIDKSQG